MLQYNCKKNTGAPDGIKEYIMMYKAYTQKGWNAEKFYIEENEEAVIIEADSETEACELFTDYIYATSLYNESETTKWIEENPMIIEEV